ncbi:MAG: hypothetical protein JWP89_7068 [Schlesneria sp.]|nr:hypothetical protein [Schlesneria sp.]
MTTQSNDGLSYLELYPRLRKKLNEYLACHRLGLKPGLPFFPAQTNLKRYFPEMAINGNHFCEHCADSIGGGGLSTRPADR